MYATHHLPLEREDHYDRPMADGTVMTAVILRGTHHDLHRAEEQFGRSVVYLPRITEMDRPSGRSRRMRAHVILQWPGYGFLHCLHEHHLPELTSRYCLMHMVRDRVTRIPVSQLAPSRDLEVSSAADAQTQSRPSLPPPPAVGDLVSVRAGAWRDFVGTVREVRRGMVLVNITQSVFPIRASFASVTVLDRKKLLA